LKKNLGVDKSTLVEELELNAAQQAKDFGTEELLWGMSCLTSASSPMHSLSQKSSRQVDRVRGLLRR
jgi:hypothetical protein